MASRAYAFSIFQTVLLNCSAGSRKTARLTVHCHCKGSGLCSTSLWVGFLEIETKRTLDHVTGVPRPRGGNKPTCDVVEKWTKKDRKRNQHTDDWQQETNQQIMKTLTYSQHCASLKKERKNWTLNLGMRSEAYASDISPLFYWFFCQIHEGQQKQLPSATVKARIVFDFAKGCFPRSRKHQHLATTQDLFDLDRKNDIIPRPENKKIRKKKQKKQRKKWNFEWARKHKKKTCFNVVLLSVENWFWYPINKVHRQKQKTEKNNEKRRVEDKLIERNTPRKKYRNNQKSQKKAKKKSIKQF